MSGRRRPLMTRMELWELPRLGALIGAAAWPPVILHQDDGPNRRPIIQSTSAHCQCRQCMHIDLFYSCLPRSLLLARRSLDIWPRRNTRHPAALGRNRYDGREAASSSTSSRCRTLGSDCSVSGGSLGRRSRRLSAPSYCHRPMVVRFRDGGIAPCPDSNCFRLCPNRLMGR